VLYLVRHGRTQANADGLLLGRGDPPLLPEGRAQAAALAAWLPKDARVVSSPLLRTRETADALERPVTLDERWIELDYGDVDGRPVLEVPDDFWQQWRRDLDFAPPNGESLAVVGARVHAACDELAEEARDHDVIVVSHVSPIKAALAWALRAEVGIAWHLFIDVASVARVAVEERGPVVCSINERPLGTTLG
jgi:broad specificity phosphatase PhoE